MRAAAALALSGRYARFGRQAAAGLRAWAESAGARLRVEDDASEPARSGRLTAELAGEADLLFGPYGSGCARAAGEAMEGRPEVLWNHGGAALPRRTARIVDVLGPAESYWRGLPEVLAAEGAREATALVEGPGEFARAVVAGARAALEGAGLALPATISLDSEDPEAAVAAAVEGGARLVVAGGRAEDELALGRALAAAGLRGALVVCGVELAGRELGEAVLGWLGPAQWAPGAGSLPVSLPPDVDYPAAQALAAGLVAERALRLAGTAEPDALWAAALALRTSTPLGPFRVDERGRQVAHAPLLVRWERGPEGPRRTVVWRPPSGSA